MFFHLILITLKAGHLIFHQNIDAFILIIQNDDCVETNPFDAVDTSKCFISDISRMSDNIGLTSFCQ
jgi:hypothetical protein